MLDSRPWTHAREVLVPAGKAGLATALAFCAGSALPPPLGDYGYYAALGAITVVGLFVAQSVRESLQIVGAVAIGVGVAVGMQSIAWANAVTVGGTVLLCLLLAALPLLGPQRTWAPIAGLFVLATGGSNPEPMAVAYLVQVPLGAAVGIVVNLLLFAPLGLDELDRAMTRVLGALPRRMRDEADRLSSPSTEATTQHPRSTELGVFHRHLQEAIVQVRRARRGNVRALLPSHRDGRVLTRAEAVSRCAAALEAVSVVVSESASAEGDAGAQLRHRAAEALEQAADTFEQAQGPGWDDESMALAGDAIDQLLADVRSTPFDAGLDHLLFGALAVTIRQSLTALRDSDLVPEQGDDGSSLA